MSFSPLVLLNALHDFRPSPPEVDVALDDAVEINMEHYVDDLDVFAQWVNGNLGDGTFIVQDVWIEDNMVIYTNSSLFGQPYDFTIAGCAYDYDELLGALGEYMKHIKDKCDAMVPVLVRRDEQAKWAADNLKSTWRALRNDELGSRSGEVVLLHCDDDYDRAHGLLRWS